MFSWNQFISSFDESDFEECIRDYEIFSTDGFIGECLLRDRASVWNKNTNTNSIVLVMERIAFEAYRYFTVKYFEMKN